MTIIHILTQFCLFLVPLCMGEHTPPKFICTPMPLEMDSICQSAQQRHSSGGTSHWVGSHEETKETILNLRETVVHQKEVILDQRETIRELTAKLTRCEALFRSRSHEDTHSHTVETGQDRDHSHEEISEGHEREHGNHERGHGYEEGHGHTREHAQEWEHGREREHVGHNRDHGHDREHAPEWEHGGHEREHGTHDRDHGSEESHGHSRDHDYHHFGHREQQQQTQQYRRVSQTQNTMGDPPKEAPLDPLQMEKMVESLKERLEHLQLSRNGSLFSASLRESLQKKIGSLEHQMAVAINATEDQNREDVGHQELPVHTLEAESMEKGSKPANPTDGFRVGFPLRSDYLFVKVKRTIRRELFAFTISLWLKSSSSSGVGTPFSYAVPGQANEIVMIEWGNNPMELLINDKVATLPLTLNDGKWHHICITWSTRDGIWEVYQDGVRKASGENLAPWHPIKPNGVFILGQEQDTLGGRFDATQAFVGEMSDVNMWSNILTPSEIFELATCSSKATGDIIEWTEPSMELHGGTTKFPFNSCH